MGPDCGQLWPIFRACFQSSLARIRHQSVVRFRRVFGRILPNSARIRPKPDVAPNRSRFKQLCLGRCGPPISAQIGPDSNELRRSRPQVGRFGLNSARLRPKSDELGLCLADLVPKIPIDVERPQLTRSFVTSKAAFECAFLAGVVVRHPLMEHAERARRNTCVARVVSEIVGFLRPRM